MATETNRKGAKNELLLVAVVKGELTTVRRLLERSSANINTKNSAGLSCLQLAILHKHFKLAEYLVQKGIDIHSRDLKGWTALHDAALMDSKVLVKKLVGKGCSLTLTTHSNELPIDLAGSVKMEKLLCEEMTLQGEQRLAREYFVNLGLEYLRDFYHEPPRLASHQSKRSVGESHQPVATCRSQILDCENRTSRSCPKPTSKYHTSTLETGNHGSLISTNYKATSPSNNHCRTRLEEALIDPPTYESSVEFRRPINSLPQLRMQSCRRQLQEAANTDISSDRDASCFDVRTTPTAAARRKVSFAIADSIMAGTTVKTAGSQSGSEKQSRSNSGGSEASDVVNPLRLPSNVIAQLNQIYEHRKKETNSSDSDEPVDRDDAIALLKMKPRRSSIASPERRKSFVNGRRRSVTFQPEVLLQEMVTDGDARAVSAVLRSGAIPDVNKMSPAGLTALHQSAIDGNLECAKTLVSNGAKVNCMDCEKWTPLHAAANTGHAELVQFLLEAGADPKMKNQDGETAYDTAKHGPIRKILLCAMNGKSPDADEFSDGEYSGEEEEEYSHAESDSDDDLVDENRVEPELFHSTAETNPESLKERLGLNHNMPPKNGSISPSPDFDTQDSVFTSTGDKSYKVCLPISRRERNFSDSMSSCGSLYEPELERIQELASGQQKTETHCLRNTEDFCHNDMDKISISEDQGIGTMDGSSDSSNRRGTLSEDEGTSCDVLDSELEQGGLDYKFQEACLYCDVDAILKLVKHRSEIDVNRVNKSSGITALHHAVLEENFALVQHLIKDFEASVLVKDTDGWTPLHAASAVGNIRIAQFLLENGAKASALNNNCEFPVDVAGDETMEKLLESAMLGPSVGKIFKGIFTRR